MVKYQPLITYAFRITGMSYAIGLTRLNYSEVEPPVGKCNRSHTLQKCIIDCKTRFIIHQCGCKKIWMEGQVPYCNLYQSLTCADVNLIKFQSLKLYDLYCNCEPTLSVVWK